MRKHILYWRCQLLGWSVYIFFNIFILLNFLPWESISYKPFLSLLVVFIQLVFTSHVYRLYIRKMQWIKLSLRKILPKVLLASLLLSLVSAFFNEIVAYYFNLPGSRENFSFLDSFFNLINIFIGLFICFAGWSLIYFLYHFVEQRNQALKDEATLKDFELNKLKSQLNPHFIFNALNSIRALVDEDPSKCKEAINQLSNILRSALIMDRQKLIPFEEELKAVKDYLALETIRFEERLNSEIYIHPDTYKYKVPPLMIQTLVENGIKHGISKLKEGGVLKLETQVQEDGGLTIKIRNSGTYKVNDKIPHGHGVANTLKRLKLLYGDHAFFKINNEKENLVLTEIFIPADKVIERT